MSAGKTKLKRGGCREDGGAAVDSQQELLERHSKPSASSGLRIEAPRDLGRSSATVLIPKHERRFTGFDDKVVAIMREACGCARSGASCSRVTR